MQHSDLAKGKWFSMSLAEQLGNVGSEYSRILHNQKNLARRNSAMERFLELLDLTISDPRWCLARKRELLRVREVSLNNFPENLQTYFDQFVLLVRNQTK